MYFWAFFFPPVAVLMAGKPFQAILCFFLLFLIWFPGVFYAVMIVNEYKNSQNTTRIVNAIRGGSSSRRPRSDSYSNRDEGRGDFDFT